MLSATPFKSYRLTLHPSSAHADGIVIVKVGPSHRKYYLHKALVLFHSEYFRKALQGSWKEAQEGVVRLKDVEPSEFNIFVHWLYNQRLPETHDYDAWDIIFEVSLPYIGHLRFCIQAYILGDRLLAPAFRRAVNSIAVSTWPMEGSSARALLPIYRLAFANIPADRLILQFLVNDFCFDWREQIDDDNTALNDLPQYFTVRALRRYSEIVKMSEEERNKKHCFLEHSSKEEQDSCSKGLHLT
ncbi:hypothetical protein EJ07DRAFT_122576 [Lizonia empirigonia]|nr:hypothetical protein EJ07DRAFT_122576 [Lizonia empirigonia]